MSGEKSETQAAQGKADDVAFMAGHNLAADYFASADAQAAKAAKAAETGHDASPAKPISYLEEGIDKVASLAISDKETRRTVDHYGSELLTTAALFAGGRRGLVATAALYGLANTNSSESAVHTAEDFALGAVKGVATRGIFSTAGFLPTAPLKGVVTGIGSRALDSVVSRDSLNDPGSIGKKLAANTFSGQAMLVDAATWSIGEGLFHGGNYLSGGRLGQNPLVRGMTMGASFGAVNGTNSEITREKAAGENIDVLNVAKHGLIEAVIGGISAGAGMRAGGMHSGVQISEATGKGVDNKGPAAGPTPLVGREGDGVSFSLGTAGGVSSKLGQILDLSKLRAAKAIPTLPESTPSADSGPAKPAPREFVIDSGKDQFKAFRDRKSDGAFLNVRERLFGEDGRSELGPKKLLFVQKVGAGDSALKAGAEKADLIVSSHPELLSEADRAKHIFPDGEGKVWLSMGGKGTSLRLATGDVHVAEWRKEGFNDPIRLDNGNVTLSVMAPLLVGDPHDINGESSRAAWKEVDRQLGEAKKLGIDAVSTDVWWGLIEPKQGQFDWSYYEKLADHITAAGLKWVPILSFHRCGGNVGDDANVPLPDWVWPDVASRASNGDVEAVKYKSEQGHTSAEYVSLFADQAVMDNYASVMKEFQSHFASRAKDIGEVNISLGPAGELRYPSYNSHDQNTGYPTRGALQAYSPLAVDSFRKYVIAKYGGHDGVGKAWNIENLDDNHILPPGDPSGFFQRGDHFNTSYGRDFFDWYNQSLVDHGQRMLSTAVSVFGQRGSPFYGIDLGAKVPGVHWRIGERQGDNVVLGDRLAELTAGLIRTSRGDWDRDVDGRGYRPIFSMFRAMQPLTPGLGSRIVPGFTCLEMADGDGGPSVRALPHTLATWAGLEAERQGLWLKGENALNGNLYNGSSWDLMRSFLTLPNQHGYYHGLTFLRMTDIVNNDTARDRVSSINSARNAFEVMRNNLRRMFGRTA
ncbi:MAG: family 14 glycosylhydrolase [Cyanobacteria bacterium REEB67]|nr:family 14 glycosylhydrolase [Cyanobacteria bacterium REEB67]